MWDPCQADHYVAIYLIEDTFSFAKVYFVFYRVIWVEHVRRTLMLLILACPHWECNPVVR
jgi:hypothetical protein